MINLPDSPAVCTRILVYSALDRSGRTKTLPWPTTLAAPKTVEVLGAVFGLVADTRVTDTTPEAA